MYVFRLLTLLEQCLQRVHVSKKSVFASLLREVALTRISGGLALLHAARAQRRPREHQAEGHRRHDMPFRDELGVYSCLDLWSGSFGSRGSFGLMTSVTVSLRKQAAVKNGAS